MSSTTFVATEPDAGRRPPHPRPKGPLSSKLTEHMRMLCRGDVRGPLTDYSRWCWSNDAASGYRVDLTELPSDGPTADDYTIAPLRPEQAAAAFSIDGLSTAEARELLARRRLWEAGMPECWAASMSGEVVYVVWGIDGARCGRDIGRFFGNVFLPVESNEILVEGAWTHPEHRGRLLNTAVVNRVLADARARGVEYGVTYCADDNIPSFMSVRANGFRRFIQRQDRWRCFRSNPTWTPVSEEIEVPTAGPST